MVGLRGDMVGWRGVMVGLSANMIGQQAVMVGLPLYMIGQQTYMIGPSPYMNGHPLFPVDRRTLFIQRKSHSGLALEWLGTYC
ncbi:MAG: hypothetical protein ABS920_04010 [Sporosarcina sp.]